MLLAAAGAALLVFLALGASALRDLDALERRFALLDRMGVIAKTRLKIVVTVAVAGGAAIGAALAAGIGLSYGEHKVERLSTELSAAQRGLFQLEQELSVTRLPASPRLATGLSAPAPPAVQPGRLNVRSSGEVKVRTVPNGPIMASLYPGAVVYAVAGSPLTWRGDYQWRQVRLPDGRTGWISDRFLEPAADSARP